MKRNQFLGYSLIILSWIFWGLMVVIPFFNFEVKVKALAISILFIATNIFWVGVFLAGKELVTRFRIGLKYKIWFEKKSIAKRIFNPKRNSLPK